MCRRRSLLNIKERFIKTRQIDRGIFVNFVKCIAFSNMLY